MSSQRQDDDRCKPRLFSIKEASTILSVSCSKLYEMVEKGEIEHHRIGGTIRFTEENLTELLERTKRERSEPERTKSQPPRPRLRHVRL